MPKPRLLDLFCGAGGAAMGYSRAGFDVVGVDINPQPHYPFEIHQADALEYCREHGHEFDAIHASPPCQAFSECTPETHRRNHVDLIDPIRQLMLESGKPFVIENVEMARVKLINPIMLCGTMFGLRIWRHRYFELHPDMFVLTNPCAHGDRPILVSGQGNKWVDGIRLPNPPVSEKRVAMEIDWMTGNEITEAIPPTYTEFIGKQLMQYLTAPMFADAIAPETNFDK